MAIDRWGSHCGVGAVTDLQCSTVVRPPAAPAALAGQRGQFWGTRGACRVWPGRVLVLVLPRAPQLAGARVLM